MTERKRRQNLAKCCSVSLQAELIKENCSKVNKVACQVLEKNPLIIGSEIWYMFDFPETSFKAD